MYRIAQRPLTHCSRGECGRDQLSHVIPVDRTPTGACHPLPPRIPIRPHLFLSLACLHARECDRSSSFASTMASLLQDLYVRFRYTRGSCSRSKMFTWRSYVLLAVGLGFLITLYRAYTLPPYSWPTHPEEDDPDRHADWAARANAVKQAFAHAYHGYETHAFPEDELLPLTNSSEMK